MALDQVLEQLNCKIKAVLGGLNLLNRDDEGNWKESPQLGSVLPRDIAPFAQCRNNRAVSTTPTTSSSN